MPALPLDEAGKYVAGAYVVFVVLITVYIAIMAAKLQRIEKELTDLARFAEQRGGRDVVERGHHPSRDPDTPGREAEDVSGIDSEVAGNV
jgi:hypothetical protein